MLPTETFAEVVGFLRLSDLSALVVTNAHCSTLSLGASSGIRWEELTGLRFYITKQRIQIFSDFVRDADGSFHTQLVTYFTFPNETDTAEFVVAAFPNCVFETMVIASFLSKPLLDAIGEVADSVIIKGALHLSGSVARWSEYSRDVFEVARKFRNAKVSFVQGSLGIPVERIRNGPPFQWANLSSHISTIAVKSLTKFSLVFVRRAFQVPPTKHTYFLLRTCFDYDDLFRTERYPLGMTNRICKFEDARFEEAARRRFRFSCLAACHRSLYYELCSGCFRHWNFTSAVE